MKKQLRIGLCILVVFTACEKRETIVDPSFRFNMVVTNPAQQLKWSIVIRPPQSDQNPALIYLNRIHDLPAFPDYREKRTVRLHLMDSLRLDPDSFEEFSRLLSHSGAWGKNDIFGPRSDGNAYRIKLQDSLRQHDFSVMGEADDEAMQALIRFCLEQFDRHFPPISVLEMNSEVELIKISRLDEKRDSLNVRVVKTGELIRIYSDLNEKAMTSETFIEMWQLFENNHIWDLKSNHEYEIKYPVEYRLVVRRGNLNHTITVYAPSKLSDKRYYNVINHIENLSVPH